MMVLLAAVIPLASCSVSKTEKACGDTEIKENKTVTTIEGNLARKTLPLPETSLPNKTEVAIFGMG